MTNINLFFSYKRGVKEDLLFSLMDQLKGRCVAQYKINDIILDRANIKTKAVFDKIKRMINEAGIFVAFITPEYLTNSLETIDEFVYAHTILKPFIYLKHDNVINNQFHYLNDANYIRFNDQSNISDIANAILEQISSIQTSELQFTKKINALLDSVRDNIDKETPEFRKKMAYSEFDNAYKEIKNILTQESYNIDLGLQRNYLYRAIPMFECANTIYAISKYDNSDFWTTQAQVILKDYIQAQSQAKKVYRIFVFENVRQLNEYKNILNYQHQSYGNKGGVYFTSLSVYNSIFNDISDHDMGDFGLLFYDNHIKIKARLNSNELSFKLANEIESRVICDIFEKKLTVENKIYKWSGNLNNKNDDLVRIMQVLFSNEPKKIKHMVLFQVSKDCRADFKKWIINFKSKMTQETKWDSLIMLSKYQKEIRDHQFKGILRIKQSNYALIFEFKNQQDLEIYYNNELHSIQRELLYKILNPDVEQYYQGLIPCKSCDPCRTSCRRKKEKIYEKIEDIMQNYIQRIDFVDGEPLEAIVNNNSKKMNFISHSKHSLHMGNASPKK